MKAVAILVELAVGMTVCFEIVDGLVSDTMTESPGTLVVESSPSELRTVEPANANGVDKNEAVDEIRAEGATVFLEVVDSGFPCPEEEALNALCWYVATFEFWDSERGFVGSALGRSIVVGSLLVCQACLLTGKILYDV